MPTQRPMKRYTIQYNPRGSFDGTSPAWDIYDHNDRHPGIIEGGYATRKHAYKMACFHNFKALGPGPWRPYRKPRAQ